MWSVDEAIKNAALQGLDITPGLFLGPEYKISGTFLRKLIISMASREPLVSAAGIRICGTRKDAIVIVGDRQAPGGRRRVDLSGLTANEGAALPPLILEYCRIEDELSLEDSRFAMLTLDHCMLARLAARSVQIEGECQLTHLGPLAEGDICQVQLMGGRIEGSLNVQGSRLCSPIPDRFGPPQRPRNSQRYALSAAGTEIEGGVVLTHNFHAIGGVSFYEATISTSIWLRNACIEAHFMAENDDEAIAIDACELKLGGSFFWRGMAPPDEWQRPGKDANPDKRFNEASKRVGNLVKQRQGAWDVDGRVLFDRARISGDIHFDDCGWRAPSHPDTPPRSGGIDIRFATVGGVMRLTGGCFVGVGPASQPHSGRRRIWGRRLTAGKQVSTAVSGSNAEQC